MVAAVPLAVALALLGIEDAFELGSGFLVAAFAVAIGVVVVMLVVGLRDLRAADARTSKASPRLILRSYHEDHGAPVLRFR